MYFNVFPNSFKCIVLEVRNKTSIYMYVPDSSEVLGFLGVPWDTILVIRVLPWRGLGVQMWISIDLGRPEMGPGQ